jgi:hypothetical protein
MIRDYIRCPACGNINDLKPHFEGKVLASFLCPCGHSFTWEEGAGPQPTTKQKGSNAMDKIKRDLQLLDDATAGDKVIRFLPCDLSPDEVRERGEHLVTELAKRDDVTDEIKRVTTELKAKVLDLDTKTMALRNAVSTRREHREVQCTEWRDFKKAQVYVVRDDLGSITETRPMTQKERQRALPGVAVDKAKSADNTDTAKADGSKTKSRQATRAAGTSA